MIDVSVPAAEATVCTMLFSWTVASRKPRNRAGDARFEKIVASLAAKEMVNR
jgi:hypothetical protein